MIKAPGGGGGERSPPPFRSSGWGDVSASRSSPASHSHFFLTGDVSGVCVLWDMRIRKPLSIFEPVRLAMSIDNIRNEDDKRGGGGGRGEEGLVGILGVGFFPKGLVLEKKNSNNNINRVEERMKRSSSWNSSPSPVPLEKTLAATENKINSSFSCINSSIKEGEEVVVQEKNSRLYEPREERRGGMRFALRRRMGNAHPSQGTLLNTNNGMEECGAYKTSHNNNHHHHTELFFFTQCRNQAVYIWRLHIPDDDHDDASSNPPLIPTLIHTLDGFQFPVGFCRMTCAYAYHHHHHHRNDNELGNLQHVSSSLSEGTNAEMDNNNSNNDNDDNDKSNKKEYSGSSENEKAVSCVVIPTVSFFALPQESTDGRITVYCAKVVEEESERSCALLLSTLVPEHHRGGFPLASSFKGGTIMCLNVCPDACHLIAGFESGHLVLARFRRNNETSARQAVPAYEGQVVGGKGEKGGQGVCSHSQDLLGSSPPSPPPASSSWAPWGGEPQVLAVIRAFPEACVTCLWDLWGASREEEDDDSEEEEIVTNNNGENTRRGRRGGGGVRAPPNAKEEATSSCYSPPSLQSSLVFAASAEGTIHCYRYNNTSSSLCLKTHSAEEDDEGRIRDGNQRMMESPLWSLLWERGLPRGVGDLVLQGPLLVAAGWDSTVRLLGKRTGQVVSILTHHCEAVNALGAWDAAMFTNALRRRGDPGSGGGVSCLFPSRRLWEKVSGVVQRICFCVDNAAGRAGGPSKRQHYYKHAWYDTTEEKRGKNSIVHSHGGILLSSPNREEKEEGEDTTKTGPRGTRWWGTLPETVHVFASCGKDSTVAIWVVDLQECVV